MKVLVVFGGQVAHIEKESLPEMTPHFAIVTLDDNECHLGYRTTYAVIHRGTGATAAVVRSRKDAIALMSRLESLPIDWGFRKKGGLAHNRAERQLAALPKAERKKLAAIYKHAAVFAVSIRLKHGNGV